MDLLLTEQQAMLRDSAAKLAARAGPRRARSLRDAGTEIDADAWRGIRDAGWLSALVPERNGGLGLGLLDLALAVEEMGRQIVMAPLIEAAAARWLLAQAGGAMPADETLIVPATLAPGYGEGGAPLRFDPHLSALTGRLPFVAFADGADQLLVDARDDGNTPMLCLVSTGAPGLTVTRTRQVDGSAPALVALTRVPLSGDAVVARGDQAVALLLRLHELLTLATAVELLGTAQAALDVTLDFLKLRQQFGKPIGSFQALQHRAVDCYVDAELNRSLLYGVIAAWDSGSGHPAMVPACKARVSRAALATVRAALQLHGAIGYTDEHDIGLYYKRAVALAAKYGNELMQVDRFSKLTLPEA
jgi:3-oxochol-4-en-24-oyl-CoA dehydrogenase